MKIECKENFEIKKLTTFKIGGKISKTWFPKTTEELVFLLKNLNDYILLGNCSNVLIFIKEFIFFFVYKLFMINLLLIS